MIKKIVLIISALLALVGLCFINATKINTKQFSIREEVLKSEKIDASLDGFCIAYFTDLHVGDLLDKEYLDEVINKIDTFKPDLILFGGDLIDIEKGTGNYDKQALIDKLKSLKAEYGKFAILGEQDEYDSSSRQEVYEILKASNFKILDNEAITISVNKNDYFNIIGINSLINGIPDYAKSFYGVNSNKYTIVMSHCPDTFEEISTYNFDYMLAGHSHGGQVYLPLINQFYREFGYKNHIKGKYSSNGKILDISTGLGYRKYKARLLADSEIVLYTLKTIDTSNNENAQ